jgi:ParB family chromosome partitioning protein
MRQLKPKLPAFETPDQTPRDSVIEIVSGGLGEIPDHTRVYVERIETDAGQMRRFFDAEKIAELADSVRTNGILQPLLVTPLSRGRYRLVAGERRLRAAKLVGLPMVPVIVRPDFDEATIQRARIVENVQREDVSPVDLAEALEIYKAETKQSWEEIAREIGWNERKVHRVRQALKAPEAVREHLSSGRLPLTHYTMIASEAPERQVELAQEIVSNGLSKRQLENEQAGARSVTGDTPRIDLPSPSRPDGSAVPTATEPAEGLLGTGSKMPPAPTFPVPSVRGRGQYTAEVRVYLTEEYDARLKHKAIDSGLRYPSGLLRKMAEWCLDYEAASGYFPWERSPTVEIVGIGEQSDSVAALEEPE